MALDENISYNAVIVELSLRFIELRVGEESHWENESRILDALI